MAECRYIGGYPVIGTRVIVEVPSKLSKEQRKELEKWEKGMELKQYDRMRKYADNVEALYGEKPYEKK